VAVAGSATITPGAAVQVVGAGQGTQVNRTSTITALGGTSVGLAATATVVVIDPLFMWFFP